MENHKRELIAFEKAFERVVLSAQPVMTEQIPLQQALNRVLGEDIFSDIDMPPFNKSAMDGFACRREDLKNELEIIEEIPAGTVPLKTIGKNQCAHIMTGGMVPAGAEVVIMKENAELIDQHKVRCLKETSKANICFAGEDLKTGTLVLKKGHVISPSAVAMLASAGSALPMVYKLPSVAILSTGNELVEPWEKPEASEIRNSNSYQIAAQCQQLGITPVYLGIVRDDEESLKSVLARAIEKYEVTIISGGVSVGDFDFVPKIMNQLKVEVHVHGMNVKPGKHLFFGQRSHHYVFGLPGNPVSSFVQFEVLVKPFLYALMGKTEAETTLILPLEEDYFPSKGDRLIFVPAIITRHGTAWPIEYHGSAHIHAYVHARGIVEIPSGISVIRKGEPVRVRPI